MGQTAAEKITKTTQYEALSERTGLFIPKNVVLYERTRHKNNAD